MGRESMLWRVAYGWTGVNVGDHGRVDNRGSVDGHAPVPDIHAPPRVREDLEALATARTYTNRDRPGRESQVLKPE